MIPNQNTTDYVGVNSESFAARGIDREAIISTLYQEHGNDSRILRKHSHTSKPAKPEKLYPDFRLTAHASGKWCKKVRGRSHYSGSWDAPIAALNEWLEVKAALIAGGDPKRNDARDVVWLVTAFLDSKDQQRQEGDSSTSRAGRFSTQGDDVSRN